MSHIKLSSSLGINKTMTGTLFNIASTSTTAYYNLSFTVYNFYRVQLIHNASRLLASLPINLLVRCLYTSVATNSDTVLNVGISIFICRFESSQFTSCKEQICCWYVFY